MNLKWNNLALNHQIMDVQHLAIEDMAMQQELLIIPIISMVYVLTSVHEFITALRNKKTIKK